MTHEIFHRLSFAVLFLLVLTSFASALSISGNNFVGDSIILTITTDLTTDTIILSDTGDLDLSFNITSLNGFTTYLVNATIQNDTSKLKYGDYSIIINATNGTEYESKVITYTKEFYEGENRDLEISELEFNVIEGFGDDEEYWYPFDEVEMTFTVENDLDAKVKDIEIEVCIWDVPAKKCVLDEEDMEIDNNEFDLKADKSNDITITFEIDADNLKEGNTEYLVYIKASGKIDDDESEDDDEITGGSISEKIEIRTDDDFIIINNIQLKPETISCGDTIELTADVWNIGDSLDEDEVYVKVYNKELGISKVFEFNSGIDAMESETITLSFELEDAEEKVYLLQLSAYNDEDLRDSSIFENEEDKESSFVKELKVAESCSTTPTASVSASLDSDAKAGQQLIVKATITNTGSATKTFALSASSYADWASSAILDKNSVTLEAGKSAEVVITLEVLKDAQGENGFDIEVVDGSKFLSQPVSVSIEKSSFGFDITGLVTGFGNNAYLYAIGALNLVLVAGIIFIAVRIARKRKQE